MRNANYVAIASTVVSGVQTVNSNVIDAEQVVSVTAQVITTSTASGTLQLQGSNDVPPPGYMNGQGSFTPTNFTNLLATAVAVTAATPLMTPYTNSCYRWLRVQYINATATSGNVQVTVNTIGLN